MKRICWIVLACGLALRAEPVAARATAEPPVDPRACCAAPAAPTGAEPQAGSAADMGLLVFVFVLAIFLGFELISKVPSQLHTPLMSGSNAISGITVVGALIAAGKGHGAVMIVLGTVAVALAMVNVVGGYLVTDRMLGMFKHKE